MPSARNTAVLLTAGALTALLLPVSASTAATSRERDLLTVGTPRVGAKAAPVTLRVRVPASARLTARVNGKPATTAFDDVSAGVRVGELTVHHGLRAGRNRITLRAQRTDGRFDTATTIVRVPATRPVADAGPDRRAVVRTPLEVGSSHAGLRGPHPKRALRWTISRRPRGAQAKLTAARTATPALTAGRAGTYVLRLTARGPGGASDDTVKVTVRPDDLPIGVPIQTFFGPANGAIRIDSTPVPRTGNPSGISYAVLERSSRAVVDSGSVERSRDGIEALSAIADARKGGLDYLMIVSSLTGVPRSSDSPLVGDPVGDLVRRLGGELTADQRQDLQGAGTPFTIIGVPGGAPGGAWIQVPTPDQDIRSPNVEGYLRVNTATDQYGFVPPDQPAFDTRAGGGANGNVVQVAGQSHSNALTGDVKNGFHVVALDSTSLKPLTNVVLTDSLADHKTMAKTIRDASKQMRPYPIVIVQSIGRPKAKTDDWDDAAHAIEDIGGTRLTFDALAGQGEYALIGRYKNGPGVESSTLTYADTARIVGNLSRSTDLTYVPVSGGPAEGVNRELTAITGQAPTPFPPFDTPGKKAAETWIATKLGLCDDDGAGTACPIRPRYYNNYQSTWSQLSTDLANDRTFGYPGAGKGFTPAEYDGVRTQIQTELSAVSRVRTYFDNLQKPLIEAREQGAIDVKRIGQTMLDQLAAKPDANATSFWLGLAGKISSLGGALPPQFRGPAAGIAAVLGLSSYLTANNGQPQLGKAITVKAAALSEELRLRLVANQRSITGIALLVVSDYGKLMSTAAKVNTDAWKLSPDNAVPLKSIDLASRRWFAEQLVPSAFPWLLRGTPPPLGPPVARALTCRGIGSGGYHQPWSAYPNVAEFRTPTNWYPDQSPIEPTIFFSRAGLNTENISPPPALADLLFNPVNPATGALGLSKLDFLSPRNFPIVANANDQAARCGDLPTR